MSVEVEVAPFVAHPIFLIGLSALGAVGAIVCVRMLTGIRAAEKFLADQFQVMDDVELAELREQVEPAKRKLWDELLTDVRGKAGDNPVRLGHVFWVTGVLEGDYPKEQPIELAVPPDLPYSIRNDIGLPAFRRFMLASADGSLVEAYEHLRVAAEKGSPFCMGAYGLALVRGDVPGSTPDPSATRWIERALSGSGGRSAAADFGLLLLEGKYVPRDAAKGLSLLAQAHSHGHVTMALELADIYAHGRHGVPVDHDKAYRWAIAEAPTWRQVLARLGINQRPWMEAQLSHLRNVKAELAEMNPWELKRMSEGLVSGLRKRMRRRA